MVAVLLCWLVVLWKGWLSLRWWFSLVVGSDLHMREVWFKDRSAQICYIYDNTVFSKKEKRWTEWGCQGSIKRIGFNVVKCWCFALSLSLQVGECVVVFSQAPSGRAPLSPSLNSRPSPISATPPSLGPDTPPLHSQSPVRSGAVANSVEEAPCVNGRWGTLRPRPASFRGGARDASHSPSSQQPSPSQLPDSPPLPTESSPSPRTSPSPHRHAQSPADYGWESPPSSSMAPPPTEQSGADGAPTPPGAVSPAALRRGLEAVKSLSSSSPPPSSSSNGSPSSSSPPSMDNHTLPPIARRLGHSVPPQSLNVGKPLYQALSCKPMQMYVLDISRASSHTVVSWRVFGNGATTGPPETSLHTVVRGRGELIIFGGLMDKKQNVKYHSKTNALYFVRAKKGHEGIK